MIMRSVLFFCLTILLFSCSSPPKNNFAERIAPLSVIETETKTKDKEAPDLVDFADLLEMVMVEDWSVPDEVPNHVFPLVETYSIHTRIIIEGQSISTEINGETVTSMWWARTQEQVKNDLDNAERLFSSIGLKFHIAEFSYKEYVPTAIPHFVEASKHPGILSIVYMLPKNFQFDGYSSVPWELFNKGIVIGYLGNEWTLTHEIGHYFGLLHVFMNDLVDDTPDQKDQYCMGEPCSTPNCGNIMGYCIHKPKSITKGQEERMLRFLRGKRLDHILGDYEDILLRGQEISVPGKRSPD